MWFFDVLSTERPDLEISEERKLASYALTSGREFDVKIFKCQGSLGEREVEGAALIIKQNL